jgi:hypothetical protein
MFPCCSSHSMGQFTHTASSFILHSFSVSVDCLEKATKHVETWLIRNDTNHRHSDQHLHSHLLFVFSSLVYIYGLRTTADLKFGNFDWILLISSHCIGKSSLRVKLCVVGWNWTHRFIDQIKIRSKKVYYYGFTDYYGRTKRNIWSTISLNDWL